MNWKSYSKYAFHWILFQVWLTLVKFWKSIMTCEKCLILQLKCIWPIIVVGSGCYCRISTFCPNTCCILACSHHEDTFVSCRTWDPLESQLLKLSGRFIKNELNDIDKNYYNNDQTDGVVSLRHMSFWGGYSVCYQLSLSVILFTSQTTMNALQHVYLINCIQYKLSVFWL